MNFDVGFVHAIRERSSFAVCATQFYLCFDCDLMLLWIECVVWVVCCVRLFVFNSTSFRAANNLFVVCAHDLRFCLFGVIYMYIFLLFCFRSVTRIRLILFVLARFFYARQQTLCTVGSCFFFNVWVSLSPSFYCSIFGFWKTMAKCFLLINQNDS